MGGGMGGMPFGMGGMGGMGGGGGGGFGGSSPTRPARKAEPLEYNFNVSLEDLYTGRLVGWVDLGGRGMADGVCAFE